MSATTATTAPLSSGTRFDPSVPLVDIHATEQMDTESLRGLYAEALHLLEVHGCVNLLLDLRDLQTSAAPLVEWLVREWWRPARQAGLAYVAVLPPTLLTARLPFEDLEEQIPRRLPDLGIARAWFDTRPRATAWLGALAESEKLRAS